MDNNIHFQFSPRTILTLLPYCNTIFKRSTWSGYFTDFHIDYYTDSIMLMLNQAL